MTDAARPAAEAPHRGWAAVSLAYRWDVADEVSGGLDSEAMSVLYDVIHSGIARFMRWPHVDVMHGALFFVYWYAVLCHHVGVRYYVIYDGDNPSLSPERLEDRRKYVRGHANDYLYCLGDPQGQAVQAAMGLMAMLSGTAEAQEMDPEEVIDYLVEQLDGARARASPEHSAQIQKDMDAAGIARPAPGT